MRWQASKVILTNECLPRYATRFTKYIGVISVVNRCQGYFSEASVTVLFLYRVWFFCLLRKSKLAKLAKKKKKQTPQTRTNISLPTIYLCIEHFNTHVIDKQILNFLACKVVTNGLISCLSMENLTILKIINLQTATTF